MKTNEHFKISTVSISRKSAEMIKHASNDFLALKISYMNDRTNLCELVDAAVILDVAKGISFDNESTAKDSKVLNAGDHVSSRIQWD